MYHIPLALSRTFFSHSPRTSCRTPPPSSGDLIRLPHPAAFVKNFFPVSRPFFSPRHRPLYAVFPCSRKAFPSLKRLLILAEPPRVVNSFFRLFPLFYALFGGHNIFRFSFPFKHKMCSAPAFFLFACQKSGSAGRAAPTGSGSRATV